MFLALVHLFTCALSLSFCRVADDSEQGPSGTVHTWRWVPEELAAAHARHGCSPRGPRPSARGNDRAW